MPLVAATMGGILGGLSPTDSASAPASTMADAFDAYFAGAQAGPTAVAPGSTSGAKSAMLGAMGDLSLDSAAGGLIAAGITAYWGVVAGAAATIFVVAVPPAIVAVPPPGLGGLQAAIDGVFASNTSGEKALADAANALADAIHGLQSGGLVNFPPPTIPIPTGLGPGIPIT